ncbi:MAG: glutamyl-tRNA reductase, partial [Gammaproteobacteria bacterium]
ANRSLDNARLLAARHGGEAIALADLPDHLPVADIVVSSTASRLPIVTRGIVELALARRRHEPMFLVDLAVPRDIEPTVGELDDAYLYTVDDLDSVISANMKLREDAAAQAEEMVHLQVQGYMDWLQVQSSSTTISTYRSRGEALREELLARAYARLDRGEDPRAVLQQLAHQLTNKLMHHPTASLRRANGRDELVRAARELLGLDGQP